MRIMGTSRQLRPKKAQHCRAVSETVVCRRGWSWKNDGDARAAEAKKEMRQALRARCKVSVVYRRG
jgi:hypothetical protein